MARIAFAVGLLLAIVGVGGAIAVGLAPGQPWDSELNDNLIFARSLPFILGFGILSGVARAWSDSALTERRSDGAIRRFSVATAFNHWINALGFLIAMTTGGIQYLKGVADVTLPFPLFWVYRIHFIGASIMVYSAGLFVTHRLIVGDRRLLPPRGQWIRHFRGLAHELPPPVGKALAALMGLNMRREPPPVEQFTYYEKAFSFPVWLILLSLILITGFLKALRYAYPIPGEVLFWASALHVAAMVGLAAKFLDHLRYVLAPSRWPLFRAMLGTSISEAYVRVRHPAWYSELVTRVSAPVEPPARLGNPASGESPAPGVPR